MGIGELLHITIGYGVLVNYGKLLDISNRLALTEPSSSTQFTKPRPSRKTRPLCGPLFAALVARSRLVVLSVEFRNPRELGKLYNRCKALIKKSAIRSRYGVLMNYLLSAVDMCADISSRCGTLMNYLILAVDMGYFMNCLISAVGPNMGY